METSQIYQLTATFEGHAQHTESGVEFWLARDLQQLLGYAKWDNFQTVIAKAKTACEVSGHAVENHFPDVRKVVRIGSGTEREIEDIMLTRYACYLIAQNGDPRKPAIAFAQTYFAIQTRRAELIEQRLLEAERVPDSRPLADFAPTIILKAKDFATEITIHNAHTHRMGTEPAISREHVTNSAAVRDTLLSRGIRPESLPPAEDVKKVERRLTSDEKKALRNPDTLEGT
jgi:DNA-damage-inducible protein D